MSNSKPAAPGPVSGNASQTGVSTPYSEMPTPPPAAPSGEDREINPRNRRSIKPKIEATPTPTPADPSTEDREINTHNRRSIKPKAGPTPTPSAPKKRSRPHKKRA